MTDRHLSEIVTGIAGTLRPIFQKYGVRQAILFGSLATGDATPRSDVDLIVTMDTEKSFFERYEGILAEITLAIDRRHVDLLIYTPAELERMRDRPFVRRALEEGVIIYESQEANARQPRKP
ncbi:MAG: nucleotidyltransferase domain-containing protein [Caldilineae bacterium]|nr:MAG: nucleotidyltransferase domain-containing protein [Caldilineae bacterium]